MPSPPVIYLDTQDYSRFGDVLRGKSDAATEGLFRRLEDLKSAGDAIFAVSMPILGELFQYSPEFRETTLRKAEAVERLCAGWALPFPSRLIASDIALAAQKHGFANVSPNVRVLSRDWYWYPNISSIFENFELTLRNGLDAEIATFPSRKLRRSAAKQARAVDLRQSARQAAPAIAAKFEIPQGVVEGCLSAVLERRITSAEASRRLFRHIAEPVNFVKTYFERTEVDKNLPAWMSTLGIQFQSMLIELRDRLRPYLGDNGPRAQIEVMVAEGAREFERTVFRMGLEDLTEFGVDPKLFPRPLNLLGLEEAVPTCCVVGSAFKAYTNQILGLRGGAEAKVEHSIGGDLVHSLYLHHVDLWRGDRRFAPLLKGAMPHYAHRIVPGLNEIPAAIVKHLAAQRHCPL